MTFKLYNTLSKRKEIFRPFKKGKVKIFVCGPTCYAPSHLGHARTYIVFDMIVKYLRQKEYDVFYLQNITDVDDKIIDRAKKAKVFWKDLSRKFEKEYLADIKALGINGVTKYARATDHIKEIINQVKRLLKKGFAYQINDGIYYDIKKFRDYGKLSRRTVLQAEDAVSRIDETKGKKNKGDFCLWKLSKPGEPKWTPPTHRPLLKDGRPGWHIEDTAICEKYFGPQYDIHGGGRDLIFPHHEAEIAQMEAISGKKPMVKYWLHSGFLTVKGQKMAKSLGNYITIKDFLKNYSARILRLFVLKNHYRSPIDYNEREIIRVKKQLERIDEFVEKIQISKSPEGNPLKAGSYGAGKFQINSKFKISKFENEFEKAMEDDLNTPKALASIFKLVSQGNSLLSKDELTPIDARDILNFLKKFDKIFGFILLEKKKVLVIPDFIKKMAKEREEARKSKDFKKADEIRRKIKKLGYWIEDTKEGPKIKKL